MAPAAKTLTFTFNHPFRVGSGLGFGLFYDHTTVRDGYWLPYIPGSTIKGRLRSLCRRVALSLAAQDPNFSHICQTLSTSEVCKPAPGKKPCIICRMFGSRFWPGSWRFGDAQVVTADRERLLQLQLIYPGKSFLLKDPPRTQVQINRRRRVAQPKHLFSGEVVPETLTFQSQITPLVISITPLEEQLLGWGATLFTHLGAQKSRGLGRCSVALA